jgi:hypothetical protein
MSDEPPINHLLHAIGGVFLIMYGTGWRLMFNEQNFIMALYALGSLGTTNYLLGEEVLAIRINSGYYGLVLTNRFFDSPPISWLGLFVSVFWISYGTVATLSARDSE